MKIKSIFKKLAVVLAVLTLVAAAAVAVMAADEYKPNGVSVSTNDEIRLDFKYPDVGNADGAKVEIGTESPITVAFTTADDNRYVVSAYLAPAQMTETVKVTLMNGETPVGTPVEYSVAKYVADANKTTNDAKELAKNKTLLNWGAMAQGLFGVNANNLANAGMFARGTNAIDAVTNIEAPTLPEKSLTTDVTAFGRQLVLGEEGVSLELYFKSSGEPTEVTVQRDGMTSPINVTPTHTTAEGYNYCVEIKHVGAALYANTYTLSVKTAEGNGGTAKYYASVIDCLSGYVSSESAAKDTAKAMYQYYAVATGENYVSECAHGGRAHFAPVSETESCYTCSRCYTALSGAINNDVNWVANIYESKQTAKFTVVTDNGTTFRRYSYDAGTAQSLDLANENAINGSVMSSRPVELGKYVVIKYRTNKQQNLKLGVGTTSDRANVGDFIAAADQSEDWQIALVDVSSAGSAKGWTASTTTNAQIRFTTLVGAEGNTATIDVALVAIVDSPEEARTLLADGETYYDRGTAFNGAGVQLDKNGECYGRVHTVAQVRSGNTVVFKCSACGAVKETRTLSDGVKYYADITDAASYSGQTTAPVNKYDEDGCFYYKEYTTGAAGTSVIITADAKDHANRYCEKVGEVDDKPLDGGRYLVMKYRVNGVDPKANIQICTNNIVTTPSKQNLNVGVNGTLPTSGWRVEVIDLTKTNYSGAFNDQHNYLYIAFYLTEAITANPGVAAATVDVAYAAVVDSVETACSLLAEDETYTVRNISTSTSTLGGTFNKGGCKGDTCTIVQERSETKVVYRCSKCYSVKETRTLPDGVKYYVDIAKPHNTTDNYAGSSNGATLKSENGMYYKNYVCPTNGNSVIFTGADSNRNPVAVSTSGSPSDSLSGGKYLVMKYRVNGTPSTTQLQIYSSTGTANRKNFAVTGTLPADGWRVEVIDLEAYATATNLFNDQSTHLYVAFFISNAMSSGASVDLAYMAVVDSKDAVHGLLNNGETYTMRTFTVTDLSKTDAGTSTLGLTYDKNVDRTYEKYILNVDKNITPPTENIAGVTADYTKSDSDGTTFARFSTDAASTAIRIRIRNNQMVGKTARYLVLKWRVPKNEAKATFGLLAGSNGKYYEGYGNRTVNASEEWIVEVIDLQRAVDNESKYILDQYDVGATFTLSVREVKNAAALTVDVAYAALVDSLEDVPEIVDGEDYTVKTGGTSSNTEWTMTGTKYNADGTPATPAE